MDGQEKAPLACGRGQSGGRRLPLLRSEEVRVLVAAALLVLHI